MFWPLAIALLAVALAACEGVSPRAFPDNSSGPGSPGTALVLSVSAEGLQNLAAVQATLVSSTAVSGAVIDHRFQVSISNGGLAGLANVRGKVTSSDSTTAVMEEDLGFGSVGAGATVTSGDTITIRHNHGAALDNNSAAITLTLVADGSGPARQVRIEPDGLIFTATGQTRTLTVRAMTAQGGQLLAPVVTWSSSHPQVISVDAGGVAHAQASSGSAQIVATVDGVPSAPLLAVVTLMPATTVVLGDGDIIGLPRETVTNGPAGTPGNTMEFSLAPGITVPGVGTLVVGNGAKPVAGRVMAVDILGGQTVVRLQPASLGELFPNLDINQTIDMSQADIRIAPEIAAAYNVTRIGNRFDFSPRTSGSSMAKLGMQAPIMATPVGTRALLPYTKCELEITGYGADGPSPIQLAVPPTFSVEVNPALEFVSSPAAGLQRLVITADPEFNLEAGIEVALAFEGSYGCELTLYEIFIPVGGALSVIAGGVVPIIAGFEVSGRFTLATIKATTKVGSSAHAELGIACVSPAGCGMVRELGSFHTSFEPVIVLPSSQGDDVRVEVGLELFGKVKVAFGNRLFRRFRLEALEAKVGGKLGGEFAPLRAQVNDPEFKAKYAASVGASVEAGTELEGLAAHFGLDELTFLSLELEIPLAESPQGTVTADRSTIDTSDEVNFTINLDPALVRFVGDFYNVREVQVVRRRSDGSAEVVANQMASLGQTSFNLPVIATTPGSAGDYYAFVITRLLPLNALALELGRATASIQVVIAPASATSAPGGSITYTAEVRGNPDQRVTWSLPGGGGTIDAGGVFTAGFQEGSFTVRATSVADPAVSATALAQVGSLSRSWAGTITVTGSNRMTNSSFYGPLDWGAGYLSPGATSTLSSQINYTFTLAVEIVLVQTPGTREFFTVSSASGTASSSHAEETRAEYRNADLGCLITLHYGDWFSGGGSDVVTDGLGLQLTSDGRYQLWGSLEARGTGQNRRLRSESFYPSDNPNCSPWLSYNHDDTETGSAAFGAGDYFAPFDHGKSSGYVTDGQISGSWTETFDEGERYGDGREGTSTTNVTWSLYPR